MHRQTQDQSEAILDHDEQLTALIVDDQGSQTEPVRLRLLSLRSYEDRPLQYSPGDEIASITLPAGYYTADVTHVLLWPDGWVAQDFHGGAPRLSRVSAYLRWKLNRWVRFDQLYNATIAERLTEIEGNIRSVDLAFTQPGRVGAVTNGMLANLIPAALGTKAPSISIRLGMGRHGPRDQYLDSDVQGSVLQLAGQAAEIVDRMIVTGRSRRTGQSLTLNLLNERLFEPVQLQHSSDSSSLPDARHTYSEMQKVYERFVADGTLDHAVHGEQMRSR